MADKIRWGILGPGSIAGKFAEGLTAIPDAELVAVGSRSAERAEAFGAKFNVPRRYAGYEAFVADAEVDAVYVATPHPFHKEHTILCLQAGKAVLCEKPFAINADDAKAMIAVARRRKIFLMEAMWTRHLPIIAEVRAWIAAGRIGEPRMVVADFAFRAGLNPKSWLFDPALGGGGLLDVGVYAVSFASMVFGGAPEEIRGLADIGATGVDEQAVMALRYKGGRLASLMCGVRTTTAHMAIVYGTDGWITVPGFWHGSRATLMAGGKEETIERPLRGNGYNYEAEETMRCLREGRLESDIMPLHETVTVMKTMDALRAQWGLRYPMERRATRRGRGRR